ncbi:transposase [Thermodesulfobacteriota bacterium]
MIRCLKEHIDKVVEGVSAGNLFLEMPTIHFSAQDDSSPVNKNVFKTREKKVVTMDIGTFRAKETVMQSLEDGTIYTCQDLKALAPHRCTFGYDIIVYVGYALFVNCRNEKDIVEELAGKNISISDREVSFLGKKFVTYLAVAHRESRQQIREAMKQRGGYILHVDGTCEADSPHLFSGLDGLAELVLDNVKIPSERAELLIPFFEQIKKQYGEPIALVHDMGKGILSAISQVFPDKPDFICHFHFLRDIGKDLMEDEYKKIRDRLKKHKIRGSLRRMAKSLEGVVVQDRSLMEMLKADITKGDVATFSEMPSVSAFALIHWVFDASAQLNGYGFPFDLPHLVFYYRLKTVYTLVEAIWQTPPRYEKTHRPLHKLFRLIKQVMDDQPLKRSANRLDEKVDVFDALRTALRIALPEGKKGLNDDGDNTEMKTIKEKVEEFRKDLTTDVKFSNSDENKKMAEQIDTYWKKLFADPIAVQTPTGELFVQPQRTNNILERFFRDLKRKARKRTGTVSLNKTLKTILSDTPLVKNLQKKEYLDMILDGCDTLEQRFARIDSKLVLQELEKNKKENSRLPLLLKKMIREPEFPQKIGLLFGC